MLAPHHSPLHHSPFTTHHSTTHLADPPWRKRALCARPTARAAHVLRVKASALDTPPPPKADRSRRDRARRASRGESRVSAGNPRRCVPANPDGAIPSRTAPRLPSHAKESTRMTGKTRNSNIGSSSPPRTAFAAQKRGSVLLFLPKLPHFWSSDGNRNGYFRYPPPRQIGNRKSRCARKPPQP
jgi:hypothetical protein